MPPPTSPGIEETPTPGWLRAAPWAAALVHVAAGLALMPEAVFRKYPDLARLYSEGRLEGAALSDASPLYLLLHLALPETGIRVLQSLAGGATVVLAAVAARRLGSGPVVASLAALLVAVAAPLLLYEAVFEPEALIALAAFGAALLVPGREDPLEVRRLAALALALAVWAALRPTGLLLLVMAAFAVFGSRREERRGRRVAAAAGLVVSVLVLAALPGAILHQGASGRGGVGEDGAVMSPGQVLHQGNRPEVAGIGGVHPFLLKSFEAQLGSPDRPDFAHELYRRFARLSTDGGETSVGTEGFWLSRALAFAGEHPAAFLWLQMRKLFFLVGPHEAHDIRQVTTRSERLPAVPFIPGTVVVPLGLLGLVVLIGMRRLPLGLAGLFAAFAAHAVIFYVSSRYRAGLLPLFALAAVCGPALFISDGPEGRRRQLTLGAVALVAAALIGGRGLPEVRTFEALRERRVAARALWAELEEARRQGDGPLVLDRAAAVLAAHPGYRWFRPFPQVPLDDPRFLDAVAARAASVADDPLGRFIHGQSLRRAGRLEEAAAVLEPLAEEGGVALSIFDRIWEPALEAARVRAGQGRSDEALAWLDVAARRRPGAVEVLALRVVLDDGDAEARRQLFALHDRPSALLALGEAALTFGRPEAALEPLEELVGLLPEAALPRWNLGVALTATGEGSRGEALRAEARALHPHYAFCILP